MKKNGVVHFEIYARDADKLSKFYSSLFDWTIEPMPGMDYHLVRTVDTDEQGMPTKPGSINGGLLVCPVGYEDPGWINYVNVDSLDSAVKRAGFGCKSDEAALARAGQGMVRDARRSTGQHVRHMGEGSRCEVRR